MHLAIAVFGVVAAVIVAAWSWLGAPVQMPQLSPGPAGPVDCLSYAPFRGRQNPLEPGTRVEPWQIDADLAQLKRQTNCIRTYSVDHGVDQVPEAARRLGMTVLHGLWLANDQALNRRQIETTVALAGRFPDTIEAIIVGNEVLLRGEMSAATLVGYIHEVKRRVRMPVTYADVWEFWLRHRDVASAVDFITIHILPYWEDHPIPVDRAARHVDLIRQRVIDAFPGKQVLVGEFGWPSAGRMREGAAPSPVNAARALHEVVAQARSKGYRINLIEAYDQPWKRRLEGTVGGHWGLYDAYAREAKFIWGGALSNHPYWRWQAAGGVALALAIVAAAFLARPRHRQPTLVIWLLVGANAAWAGTFVGWTIANVPVESLTSLDWARSLGWAVVAVCAPVAGAVAAVRRVGVPRLSFVLGKTSEAPRSPLSVLLGWLLVALVVLSLQAALGLVFNPRYRDFPFAPLSAAVVPFVLLTPSLPSRRHVRASAETVTAGVLALCAGYILVNETFANWQALWFCAALLALAVSLPAARDARD